MNHEIKDSKNNQNKYYGAVDIEQYSEQDS